MLALFLSVSIVIMSIIGFSLTQRYQVKLIWGVNLLWSSLLTINRTRLSELQIDWSLSEQILISLLIFIPSIFTFLLIQSSSTRSYSLESTVDGDSRGFESESISKAITVIIVLAALIFLVDFILHGIPILNLNLGSVILNESRLSVRIPILYSLAHYLVLVATIASSILFFSKKSTSKLLWILVFLYVVVNILHFGRGTLIVFSAVIAICYYIFSPKSLVRKAAITIGPIFFMFIVFSILGNFRQNQGVEFGIIEYGNFDAGTFELVAWIYGYAVINFDNLILCIRDYDLRDYVGYKTLLNFAPAFIGEILNLEYASTSVDGVQTLPYVGRFNLPTSFGTFGYDYGWIGVYSYSFFIILLVPLLLRSAFIKMTFISRILLVYLSLSYLFLTITNYIFSSRFILFIFSLLIIKLLINKFHHSTIKIIYK
jgi:oligosaccharide repeat unit polymerase